MTDNAEGNYLTSLGEIGKVLEFRRNRISRKKSENRSILYHLFIEFFIYILSIILFIISIILFIFIGLSGCIFDMFCHFILYISLFGITCSFLMVTIYGYYTAYYILYISLFVIIWSFLVIIALILLLICISLILFLWRDYLITRLNEIIKRITEKLQTATFPAFRTFATFCNFLQYLVQLFETFRKSCKFATFKHFLKFCGRRLLEIPKKLLNF